MCSDPQSFDLQSFNSSFENITALPYLKHDNYDFFNIAFMCIVFVIAAPLNISVLRCLIRQLKSGRPNRAQYLQFHLFISDLFLILFYIPCYIVWSITIEFFGSDIGCKMTKFITAFQFYLSSNMVVCISLDRILQVTLVNQNSEKFQKAIAFFAYIAAAVLSIPQLYFWRLEILLGRYQHCSDVSTMIEFHENIDWPEYFYYYSLSHLLAVFWIPLMLIFSAYAFVLLQIRRTNAASAVRSLSTSSSNSHLYRMTINNKLSSQSADSREIISLSRRRYPHDRSMLNKFRRSPTRLCENPSRRVLVSVDSKFRRAIAQNRATSKAIKTASLLVAAFIIFRFPFNLVDLLLLRETLEYTCEVVKVSSFLYVWSVLTSVVNPFIYHRINATVNRNSRNSCWHGCNKLIFHNRQLR